MIALVSIGRFVAAHWRAAVVALLAVALFSLGWHYGAARVTAQWTAEKTAAQAAQAKELSKALANQQAAEGRSPPSTNSLTTRCHNMRTTFLFIALSLLLALSGCPSTLPVACLRAKAPAPPAALMVPPPTQTSLQRLQTALQK